MCLIHLKAASRLLSVCFRWRMYGLDFFILLAACIIHFVLPHSPLTHPLKMQAYDHPICGVSALLYFCCLYILMMWTCGLFIFKILHLRRSSLRVVSLKCFMEWCVIWWQINNYVFFIITVPALCGENLKITHTHVHTHTHTDAHILSWGYVCACVSVWRFWCCR